MRRSNAGVLKLATPQSTLRALPFATSTRSLAFSAPVVLPRLTPGSFRPVIESRLPPPIVDAGQASGQASAQTPPTKTGRKKRVTVATNEVQPTTYNPVQHTTPPPSKIPPPKAGKPRPVPDLENGLRAHLLVSLTAKVQLGPEEPVIATVCPYEGGDSQCFEVVKTAVGQIEGDIVEIDLTAALALGAHGPLGQAADCIDLPVNPLQAASSQSSTKSFDGWEEVDEPNEDGEESMALPGGARVVRLNLSKAIPGLSGGGSGGMMAEPIMFGQPGMGMGLEEDTTFINPEIRDFFMGLINAGDQGSSKPRVIFLRDAAGMHATFDAWWPSFVAAVNLRRRGVYESKDKAGSDLVNPTTIVLGVAPSLLHVGNHTGGGPTTFPLLGAREALYQALEMKDKQSPSVNRHVRRRANPAHEEPDEAKLWMSSPETDEAGRELRATKRMNAMDNGVVDLPYVLPPFGPKLSDIPPAPPNPTNPLAALFGGGSSSTSLGSISTKFPWRTVPVIPPQDVERDMIERHQRRQLLNALQIGRAMSELGGTLQDPLSAVGNLKNKSSRQLQESLELEEITAQFPLQILPWVEAKQLASLAIGSALQVDFKKPAGQELVIKWRDVLRAAVAEGDTRVVNSQSISKRHEAKFYAKNFRKMYRVGSGTAFAQSEDDTVKKDQVVDDLKNDRSLNNYEKRLLSCIVDPTKLAETSFEDVYLPEKTIDGIRSMVSMPLLYPEAFSSGILKNHSSSGALLFGPPGTGKTLLARALARESGARMLAIQPSDVNDMYVGEGEKLVKAVFSLARRLSPCIVFLDEVDSLFGKRASHSSNAAQSYRQILTEFMQEMDGLSSATANKESKVMVIGATNRPFDLDEAVLRRLPRRMLVDLPNAEAREQILKIMLRSETLSDDVDLKKLAEETVSFSGSDLKHLCVSAAFAAIKDIIIVPWKKDPTKRPNLAPTVNPEPVSTGSGPGTESEPIVIEDPEEAVIEPERTQAEPITVFKAAPKTATDKIDPPRAFDVVFTDKADGKIRIDRLRLPVEGSGNESTEQKEEDKAPARILKAKHFKTALSEIRASASEDGEIAELRKWSDRFGEGGTQRGKKSGFGGGFGFGDGAFKQAEYGSVKQD